MDIVNITGRAPDIAAANEIIGAALLTWSVSDRVRRLIADTYRYHADDAADVWLGRVDGRPVGVLGLLQAGGALTDMPGGSTLLHGLFVSPDHFGKGYGAALVRHAHAIAAGAGSTRLLVKANRDARRFFERVGFEKTDLIDYPHAYVMKIALPDRPAPAED